jgi:hypothetical protein
MEAPHCSKAPIAINEKLKTNDDPGTSVLFLETGAIFLGKDISELRSCSQFRRACKNLFPHKPHNYKVVTTSMNKSLEQEPSTLDELYDEESNSTLEEKADKVLRTKPFIILVAMCAALGGLIFGKIPLVACQPHTQE